MENLGPPPPAAATSQMLLTPMEAHNARQQVRWKQSIWTENNEKN